MSDGSILIATIAGLFTAFFWGTGDWLAAKSTKKLGTIEINFAVSAVGIVLAAAVFIFSDVNIPRMDAIFLVLMSNAFLTVGYLLLVKALKYGAVGIIVPLGNSYPVITVLLTVLFLNEIFSTGQFVAMAAIIVGACVLGYESNHKGIPAKELHKDTILAVGAALAFGIAFFLAGIALETITWQQLVSLSFSFGLIWASIIFIFKHRKNSLRMVKRTLSHAVVLLAGATGSLGAITFYLGSDYAGSPIIPAVISAAGPLVASAWSATIDKERLGTIKRTGAVLIVSGVIILNLA